jgi:mitochondrial fission protein ELM1
MCATGAKEVINKKHEALLMQLTTLQTTHNAMKQEFSDQLQQLRSTQQSIPMAFNSVVPRYQDMTQNIVEYVPVPPTNMVNMNTPAAMMQQFKNLQQQQQQQMAALFGGNRGIQQGAFGSF